MVIFEIFKKWKIDQNSKGLTWLTVGDLACLASLCAVGVFGSWSLVPWFLVSRAFEQWAVCLVNPLALSLG